MRKIIAILLIACILAPQLAFAGAWTLPKGDVWMQWTTKWNWAKEQYIWNKHVARYPRDGRAWGWSMIPEIHYGATDWLDFMYKMEYKESHYKEYARPAWDSPQQTGWGTYSVKNHGLVTFEPAVRIRLLKEPLVISTQFWWLIWNDLYEGFPLQDVSEQPGLSDRTNSFDMRILLGKKWDTKIPFYMGFETGYRWNTRNICNQIPVFYEAGFWPLKWLLIKTELDCLLSHEGMNDNALEKSYSIWRIGPSIQLLTIYQLLKGEDVTSKQFTSDVTRATKSFNLECQYGNTFAGKNTAASQEVVIKVSAQF